jgi:predicted AAA+ superfamily ATPase
MQSLCGFSEDILNGDIIQINMGALTEQFVGQELLAYEDPYRKSGLHYWARKKKNSSAEVDYLCTFGSHVIPIEVKSGKTGRLRSLHSFINAYKPELALRVYAAPYRVDETIVSVPLYGIGGVRRLLESLLSRDRVK